MAKDVAQRETDQSGFRISNLGDPNAAGDATKTDNTTVPQPNATVGFAGQSLLAAPADHVHPIASNHYPYVLGLSDLTEQSQTGPAETVIAQFPVDFAALPLGSLIATLAAVVEVDHGTATFNLRLGPAPEVVDGVILATITTVPGVFEAKSFSSDPFARPDAAAFLKVTAANDHAAATCRIRNKTVVLHSV